MSKSFGSMTGTSSGETIFEDAARRPPRAGADSSSIAAGPAGTAFLTAAGGGAWPVPDRQRTTARTSTAASAANVNAWRLEPSVRAIYPVLRAGTAPRAGAGAGPAGLRDESGASSRSLK